MSSWERGMMRLTMAIWWSLALVWFVTAQAGAGPAQAQIARRAEVPGYGSTVEAARKRAVREALATLQEELRKEGIEHWQPTEALVRRHLLEGDGHADQDVEGQKSWVVKLQIPASEALWNLEREALRREIAEARMGIAFHVGAALALLLSVVVGGIYLDEWTRSRYTAWLRIAGAAVLSAAAVGWLWMR